jgi:uncharacterized protein
MTDSRRDVAWADANPFVSLIVGPDHSTHPEALSLFREVAEGRLQLIVTPVIVYEIVNVLEFRYQRSRAPIASELGGILQADGLVTVEKDVLTAALDLYGHTERLDFADAYLAARAEIEGPSMVASFDRDLDRIEGIRRIGP